MQNMADQLSNVAEAFSRKSKVYDAFGEGHVNLIRMRRKVYDHIASLAPSAGRLLEINAGTGLDAVEMVKRGYIVHATDLSPGMVFEIRRKIADNGLENRLSAQQCSFADLHEVKGAPFDAIYSNFGGLNCTDDLRSVVNNLVPLLKPGGVVTWVIMPRICPWELARTFKDWRVGTRRLSASGIEANVEGIRFMTYYYSASEVKSAFGSGFHQAKLQGLSVATPPADNDQFATRFPRLFRWLAKLDDRISHQPPFNGWGDFFILSMVYNG